MPYVRCTADAPHFLGVCNTFVSQLLRTKCPQLKREPVRQFASKKYIGVKEVPIYDFRCRQCDRVSEIFLRSIADKAVRCPDCGSSSLERLISPSYLLRAGSKATGRTCCGRNERCETPPCSTGDTCQRD